MVSNVDGSTTTTTYYYKTDKGTYNYTNTKYKTSLTYTYDYKTDKLQCVTTPSSYSDLCNNSAFSGGLTIMSNIRSLVKRAIKEAGVNVNNL